MSEVFLRTSIYTIDYQKSEGWWKWNWHTQRTSDSPTYLPNIYEFNSLLGWVPKKNTKTKDEAGNEITINSAGVRSTKEYSLNLKSKLRFVTLGDSYTFGQCVGDRETYSSYLEKILPYTEVLNFGVKAYGFDQMLLRLPSALTFQPDIVIVGFYNDDVERVKYSFIDYQKPKFKLIDGKLKLVNRPLIHPEKYAKQFHLLITDIFRMFVDRYFKNQVKEDQMTSNITMSILSEIKKAVNQAGASLYLLYLPTYGEVSSNIPSSHRAYNKFCLNNEEFCLDPTEAMFKYIQARSDPESYFSCHYAKEIHEVIANYVKDNIILEKY